MKDLAPLDEMVDGQRRIRPHWQGAMAALADLPDGGLAARAMRLDRALAEDGARSLLAGPGAAAWRCDAVPLPIPPPPSSRRWKPASRSAPGCWRRCWPTSTARKPWCPRGDPARPRLRQPRLPVPGARRRPPQPSP